ncbi:hypothetical protein [Desulfocucumis palustris]|uniref:hypothetical protein n=1 Tax=Desulfocucumis palustris TaxID=1898651 RepID=UPI000FFF09A7|nr:hypothetical protein [Desulfocucumis palustris]
MFLRYKKERYPAVSLSLLNLMGRSGRSTTNGVFDEQTFTNLEERLVDIENTVDDEIKSE